MHLEVQGEVSIAELRHMFRESRRLRHQPPGMERQLFALALLAFAVLLGIGHSIPLAVACGAVGLLLFFPRLFALPWELYWQYAVLPAEYEHHRGLFRLRLVLTDESLNLEDGLGHRQSYPWDAYDGCVEDEVGFLLHGSPSAPAGAAAAGQAPVLHFLPRHFFTPEQAAEFSAFLKGKYGERD